MKIKTKTLRDFFKKVSTNNTVLEFKANFEAQGVNVICVNNTNTVKSRVSLSSSSFETYESIGLVGFQNVDKIITILGKLGEEVDLKVEGNLVIFKSESKAVETELMKEDLIDNHQFKIPEDKVPKNPDEVVEKLQTITLNAQHFNSLIGDISINKDYSINFSGGQGTLIIKNTGGFRFTDKISCEDLKQQVSVSFGYPIVDSFKNLENDCSLLIKSNYPLYIKEVAEGLVTERLIAPRIENK